jgi:hypothetical protein
MHPCQGRFENEPPSRRLKSDPSSEAATGLGPVAGVPVRGVG